MKRFFHTELEAFRSNLALMGQKSIENVRVSMQALQEQNMALADEALRKDDEIDDLEILIDAEAVRYMSLRSPLAQDLRLLMVGMKVSHDMERVGDESCSIAKRAKKLAVLHPAADYDAIPQMAELALGMLRDSLNSLLDGNIDLALAIPGRDKEVDRLNREVYAILSERLAVNPAQIGSTLDLMFIAKSLERVADHATNIAEEVIYLFKGQDVRHSAEIKEFKNAN
ncbi:MAG: phosphate signaling complex protein PhoU [Verrucomicrobiota bacterium]|nr:phosphate signaling complex protein PhoU [Verrucomicrobiota bacterium]